jgi:hypothetical protein
LTVDADSSLVGFFSHVQTTSIRRVALARSCASTAINTSP